MISITTSQAVVVALGFFGLGLLAATVMNSIILHAVAAAIRRAKETVSHG